MVANASSRIRNSFIFGSTFCFRFLALCQSTQPSEREGEQSKHQGKQSKKRSEKGGGKSRQPSGRAGEQSEKPSEPVTPHDVNCF